MAGAGGPAVTPPTLAALAVTTPEIVLDPAQMSAHAQAWRQERVRRQEALMAALGLSQAQVGLLNAVLDARAEEERYRGGQIAANATRAALRATSRAENTEMAQQLQAAAEHNRDLRIRADVAEKELAALRATLPGLERVIRGKVIAAAPEDHAPLPRLAPRSGVFPRFLSNDVQVRRIARRIEEFMAGDHCRGYARPEKLREFLLPEVPGHVYTQAITHLMLSKRITQSKSGAYRLRAGEPKAARPLPRPLAMPKAG